MSGPKAKCPSCGTEWDGPVIFCGECGTPISQPTERPSAPAPTSGDRVARLPPPTPAPAATPEAVTSAAIPLTRSGKPDISHMNAGDRRTALGLNLKATITMPAVVPPPASPPGPPDRPAKGSGRRKAKSLPAIHVEPSGREETQRILEDVDAGFDSIVRPSDLPVPPPSAPGSSPVAARVTVPMGMELFEAPSSKSTAEPPAPAATIELKPAEADPAPPAPVSEEMPAIEITTASDPAPPSPEAEAEAAAARKAQHEADMAHVRALFADMAVGHARPLRDFMIEVTWGDPSKEWLEVATPAVTGLRRASEALEMPELSGALEGVAAALELAAGEAAINPEVKELLAGAYAKLVEVLPAAFTLDRERGQRETVIVRSLLQQVPGVQKVALDRIWAAGLTSLSMLYAARARDLAEATGLDEALAAAIVDKFQAHRRAMAELAPGKDRANERAELAALVSELERVHAAHEEAQKGWGPGSDARKAALRRERADVMLRIDVALAHLGEVERQRSLEKLPFAQKIRELCRFLEEARS